LGLLAVTEIDFPAKIAGISVEPFMQDYSLAILISMIVGAFIIARYRP